jgi:hypothetical protein
MEMLQAEIINFVVVVIAGCVGIATKAVMSYLKKKGIIAKIEGHKELASIVVGAIEQTYKHLHGEEKLNLAKIELIKLAKEKGLKISEKELDLLIESSVKEMNKAIKENK